MYQFSLNPLRLKVHPNIYCIGVQSLSKEYNYALCQDTKNTKFPGLRLFNMESIVKTNTVDFILLKALDIGTLGYLEYE